jgi:hypothetical protein
VERGKPAEWLVANGILADDPAACTVIDVTSPKCFPFFLQLFYAICPERCQICDGSEPPGGRSVACSKNIQGNEGLTHETRRCNHQTLQA